MIPGTSPLTRSPKFDSHDGHGTYYRQGKIVDMNQAQLDACKAGLQRDQVKAASKIKRKLSYD